ncbi:MAG: PSD1 and planctomycete cytochrome C domain-containing protein [Prosthecobacter sp.]|nr:PSD1 and planctomycete cytochrome C domain-containing protein [Prosthecobacter sp.]
MPRLLTSHALLSSALTGLLALPAQAVDSAAGIEFFEKKVRPVLVERCLECHSATKKIKGGLSLDSRDLILKGGDSGPAIVLGQPDRSRLIEAVRYKNQDMQMPPKSPLPAAELQALEQWVKMGAPDPRVAASTVAAKPAMGMDLKTGREFWSFRPVSNPAVPKVANTGWVRTPVDAFILAKLEAQQLTPAPPADAATLIRRATQDLTGLPPTPEELATFVRECARELGMNETAQQPPVAPAAMERLIERLLASPAYGERWGRHWLDVARYADSNGMDENVAFGHAWRYRDYVVRSFNQDKPYDQFLIEQIAGDLLPDTAHRADALAATGFLAIGAKVLAEPDVKKFQYDTIDEQLDTLGKAFLGMTFGCARCHDHKFDPITQADYFGLATIFEGTRSIADEKMGAIKFWYEHSQATPEQLAAKKAHEARVAEKRKTVTSFTAKARAELKKELHEKAADYLAAAAQLPDDPAFAEVEKLAQATGLRARYLLTCRQYLSRQQEHAFFAPWHKLRAAGQSASVRSHYAPLFEAALKLDPKAKETAPPDIAAARAALDDAAGFLTIPDKDADAFDATTLAQIQGMMDDLMQVEDATPDPPAFMGVADAATIPRSMPIHIRGSHLTLGREVPRGFPEVMRTSLTQPIFPTRQSGRLELARWLASSEHPLTARVMVNRLWRWHFGKGIVASTDNFGTLGDRPSHPELLDWLARTFMESGWSIKDMHRLIMRSSTYQMASSHPNSSGTATSARHPAQVDPENRLLWRFHLQRLEAEQIRDALLHVSGTLHREIGGKTIPLRNREFVFNHTSRDHTTYESPRRALYLPIIRNHLYDMLEQFDYPDPTMPTGSRNTTTVAPQALIMLNAPVVMDAAAALARRLAAELPKGDTTARLHRAYVLAYGRQPTTRELERATQLLESSPDRQSAWQLLCHSLLAANEFIYLR